MKHFLNLSVLFSEVEKDGHVVLVLVAFSSAEGHREDYEDCYLCSSKVSYQIVKVVVVVAV